MTQGGEYPLDKKQIPDSKAREDYMDKKEVNKRYRSIIRRHTRSGAPHQALKEIDCKPCGEASPYREWMANNPLAGHLDGVESENKFASGDSRAFQATGDIQSIQKNIDHTTDVVGRVRKLIDLSKQILTEQQYHVFVLMAVKEPHLTVRETAKVLSISTSRVGQLWQAARKKLEKAYDTRTA